MKKSIRNQWGSLRRTFPHGTETHLIFAFGWECQSIGVYFWHGLTLSHVKCASILLVDRSMAVAILFGMSSCSGVLAVTRIAFVVAGSNVGLVEFWVSYGA